MTAAVRRLACAWLLAAALAPAAAPAQGPSPQLDRDSPAGVEYQLPLERAREQAAGAPSRAGRSTEAIPLFGVGVKRSPARAPRTRGGAGTADTGRAPQASRRDARTPAVVRAEAPSPGGGGGLLLAGAAGTGVLALGALAGLGWRRHAMRQGHSAI